MLLNHSSVLNNSSILDNLSVLDNSSLLDNYSVHNLPIFQERQYLSSASEMEDMSFDTAMPLSLSPSPEKDMSFELNVLDWNLSPSEEYISDHYDNVFSKNKRTRLSTLVYDNSPGGETVPLMMSSTYQPNNDNECSRESKDSGISDVGASPVTNILTFSSHCFTNSSNSSGFELCDSSDCTMNLHTITRDNTGKCKRQLTMPSNAGSHSKIRRKLNLTADLRDQCADDDKENNRPKIKQTSRSATLKRLCFESPSPIELKSSPRRGLVDVSNTFDTNSYKTNDELGRCFIDVSDSPPSLSDRPSKGFIKEVLDQSEEQSDPIGDFSAQHVLPVIQGRHKDLKSISHDTLRAVLRQEYSDVIGELTIVDARYPYEYAGGHIEGAKNLSTEDAILSELFVKTQPSTSAKRNVLFFHCEFSIERGPKMLRFLRSHDRDVHKDSYPQLSYPEIYLLENGYKSFYESHPQHCSPGGYRPMLHPDYTEDLRRCRSGSNTSEDSRKGKSKSSRRAVLQFDE